jgi:Flp pilus assembly protein TadD
VEPNRVRALLNAARYRLALGQLDRALSHADRARRVAPGEADGWALAGLADARAGRSERARARLHRALEIEPRHREARDALRTLDRIAPAGGAGR